VRIDPAAVITEHALPSAFCPRYHHAVELIGRRWTGAILRALLSGEQRFSDIADAVPGLSDRLLSERLKELEAEEILTRTVIPETPVRVEYRLTYKGRALAPVVEAVSAWAETWGDVGEIPSAECLEVHQE
jgi:DNA-binding HxlR family transcriptional regulator